MAEERPIQSIQEHWIVLILPVFLFLFGIAFSATLYVSGTAFLEQSALLRQLLWLCALVIATMVVHLFGVLLISRELSAWVLTSRRIVLLEFLPYLRHDVEILPLAEMHEIEKKKHGLIPNLLNYGDLEVNIGSIPKPLIFKKVPRPTDVANVLGELYRLNHPEEKSQKS